MGRVKEVGHNFVGFFSTWNQNGTWEAEGRGLIESQLYNIEIIAREASKAISVSNPESAVLEVGCFAGGSIKRWIEILMDCKRNSPLIAVDPYDNPNNYMCNDVKPLIDSLKTVLAVYPNSHFHQIKSDEFFKLQIDEMKHGLSFALIDGMHEEEQMKRDFLNVIPYMRPNGLLVLDDISWIEGLDGWVLETFVGHAIQWLPGNKPNFPITPRHQALIWF